jgi:hypothetical protein
MDSNPKEQHTNLAGIIPLAGREDKLNLPLPDYMQPLGDGITALEKSVYECARVGCKTIWIICNDDTLPIVKKRLGDYVMDPIIYDTWSFKRIPNLSKTYIPIYYTPVLQKDRNRKDTLGWSVLHGALTAFIVSSKISRWVAPTSYFVSFPYGINHPKTMKQARGDIRSGKRVYAEYEGKTVRDGLYLPFSFTPEDWLEFRRQINENNTGGNKDLPIEERWSAKHFTLDKIFKHDNIEIEKTVNIPQYFTLDSWDELREYYRSDLYIRKMTKTMSKPFFLRKDQINDD